MPAKIPVLSQVGTVKVGIGTLAFLAVTCGVLTVWYEHPEQVLGKSWFIRIPLVVLALNLFSITVTRFRKSWTQFGMISTHVGLITILVGAFITSVMGINGTVQFSEGESTSTYTESHEVLAVKENPDALPLQVPVSFGAAPDREDVRVGLKLPGGTTVSIEKYYHHYDATTELKNDAEQPNPRLEILGWSELDGQQGDLVQEGERAHGVLRLGGLDTLVFCTPVRDEAEVQRAVESVGKHWMGQVSVQATGRAEPQPIEVGDSIGKDVAIEGTPYTLRLDRFLPSFQVGEDKQESSVDEHLRNPVVLATLTGPNGTEKKRIYSQLQPPHDVTTWPDGIQVRYMIAPFINVHRLPDGRLFAVGNLLDDPKKPLELGKEPVPIEWLGAMLHASFYSHARIDSKPNNANPDPDALPRACITVRHGALSKSVWVPLTREDEWTTVALGEARIEVGFQRVTQSFKFPFQVTLDKFIEQNYEGSASPMAWESHLTVKDVEKGETFQYPIKMNEPLFYRGWKFFQSGKDQDPATGVWISTLSISWDPGQWFIYVGCFFVTVGVLFLFYAKQAVLRWESNRLAARGASPKSTAPAPAPEASLKG